MIKITQMAKIVNTYSNEAEAYIDRGLLESHGIPAQVEAGALSELFPAPGAGTGSIRLLVPDSVVAEAERIIRESRQ